MGTKKLKYLLLAWVFICTLSMAQEFLTNVFRPEFTDLHKALIYSLIRFSSGVLVTFVLLLPLYELLRKKSAVIRTIGFIGLGFFFILVYVTINVLGYLLFFMEITWYNLQYGVIEQVISGLRVITLYYTLILGILMVMDYFNEKREAMAKKKKLELELFMAKFDNLKNQLQPHFLFNSINSVISIIDEKKDDAQNMLVDISDLLRKSMDTDFSKRITLHEEISILTLYLNIEKRRFEHQLNIQFDIDVETSFLYVPPFLLQPLTENAIKHGFSKGTKKLLLLIKTYMEDEYLIIKIINNGKILSDFQQGIGLKNLHARLENEYGTDYEFSLSQNGEFVTSLLKIKTHEN
ncbi:MAG: sensor histidine kinase [Croceivirga sp.]